MDKSEIEPSEISAGESLAVILRRIIRSSRYRTQEALARELNVTQGTISNYLRENSRRSPSPENIRRIAALCARSPEERVQYEQAMLHARARQQFPGFVSSMFSSAVLPPLEFSVLFRDRVRQDLAKWPLRRWRGLVQQQGLTWRVVQRMLDGRGVLTVEQVRALARALNANEEIYLALVRAPTERFYQMIAGQHELLAELLTMPSSSRKDVEAVLRQSAQHGLPRSSDPSPSRRPKARSSSQKKPLGRVR